ncbi:uncharacterized protein BDZ99DRAFT_464891 [Mytilinidion resinicola]|uniref:Uncharacterized protein n=1 Tax=Mytilinidion resinicola TaxID=574789 RepID=A0A6A6YJ99_9PEZI|nr:uncharacterized protein BDZ99DRAFT_464891 [Mytilinidion resinicola]KAF2807997.1 hypothetical protein BDZ99DRAFT_464891 [Mytilinidion resinicola]
MLSRSAPTPLPPPRCSRTRGPFKPLRHSEATPIYRCAALKTGRVGRGCHFSTSPALANVAYDCSCRRPLDPASVWFGAA